MKKILSIAILFTALISLNSCCDIICELKEEINVAISNDNIIDTNEYNDIVHFINLNKKKLQSNKVDLFDDNNNLSTEKLLKYMHSLQLYKRKNPKIECDSNEPEIVIIPKLYLERSGSMLPYASSQGEGYFKKAICDILNKFNQTGCSQNLIYIVNNVINQLDMSFSNFIQLPNIYGATTNLGDPRYTDFDKIFSTILEKTNENQLSILVSDLIYSTRNLANKNNIQVVNEIESITQNNFNKYSNDYSFILIKLNSDYIGDYYPYCHPTKCIEFQYNEKRPYYICFIGKNEVISALMKYEKYKTLRDFESLPEFKKYHIFYEIPEYEIPYYSVLLGDKDNSTTIKPTKNALKSGQITELGNAKLDRFGNYKFKIAVDLSNVFLDDDFKCNIRNYEVDALDTFKIENIEGLNKATINKAAERYLRSSTHIITVSTNKIEHKDQILKVNLLNKFPDWIIKSSTNDDTNQDNPDFSTTTFGLKSMMTGIYNAYYQSEKPELFSIEIKFKN